MNGQKGVAIIVIAMVLTGSIGLFANMNEDWTTKTVYDKVTDLEGIIGQNAGTVDSYDSFYPLRNVTGWEGKNAQIPTTNTTTPYVINPYRNNYIWDAPVEFNMRSLTHTVGGAIFGPKDTLPFSDSAWATNKSGVTYKMYPVDGDETTAGRDAWIKYTDGTYVHGGATAEDISYSASVLPPHLDSQTIYLKYYVLGELQSKTVIFDTVSDLMSKIGKTLQNNQLISIDGGYIVFAGDLHATKTSQHEQDRFNNVVIAESKIFLDGTKSNVNTIKYNNGTYSGVTTLGGVEWESQAVYFVSTQSKITITVGTPIDGEPRYADPYKLVTLEDSGYSLDEEPYSFTYNYTDNIYTTGSARTSVTYQWYFLDELRVRVINPIPHGNGSTYVTLSNGETMLWPDDFRQVWDESTESYITPYTLGIRGGILGSDFSYEDGDFDVRAKYPVSGQTSYTTSSSGWAMFIYSDDLLNKYIPSPQIGDVVIFGKNVSSSTGEIMVATNLRQDGTSGQVTVGFIANTNLISPYNVISYDYQIGNNYTSNPEKLVNLMNVKFTYTSDGWIMSDVVGDTVYPRLTPRSHDSDSKGNLIFCTAPDQLSSSAPPIVKIFYTPAKIVYNTTQSGVYLADFNETPLAYTDGTPWHGGYSVISNGTYPSVDYVIPDADGVDVSYDYVRWSNLEDVLRAQNGIKSLGSLVQIQFESIDTPTSKTILTTDISQTVTADDSKYTVSMDSYRNRIVCDYLHTVINSQGVTIWEAYSGTDVVWSGELSELYLVQAQIGRITPPATQIQTILSGYAWDSNPGDDEKVVWWSNSVLNATVVNGSVSFLFMPQSTVFTELQVYTGDTLVLDATPIGANYQLTYTLNDNEPVAIGEYVGLYVSYSVLDNTLSIQGVMSYENTKLYVLSPVVQTVPIEYTESLSYVYFITFFGDWGAYVTETVISNDPMGYLWGDFNVNLDNYLSQYFPGLRVTIGGVVRYGDSFTVNNIVFPVADGKFTYEDTQYELRGVAIDYMEDNSVIMHVGNSATLNLGTAQNHTISGEGAWYFSSGAFEINETKVKEYKWSPGWDLSFAEMMVLFLIILIGMAVIFMRVEWIGGLDRYDIIVLGIVTIISFLLIGGTR